MGDDKQRQMKAAAAVIAVIVGIGLAVFSGVHSLAETKPHIVGTLGPNPQGPAAAKAAQAAVDPAMGGGKAASDKN